MWEWFRLNVGARACAHPDGNTIADVHGGGLTVTVRRLAYRPPSPDACVNPIERLTVTGRGALVMLEDVGSIPTLLRRFSPAAPLRAQRQPATDRLLRTDRRPGWFFNFRDQGRGFYVYVYLGQPRTPPRRRSRSSTASGSSLAPSRPAATQAPASSFAP